MIELPAPRSEVFVCTHCTEKAKHISIHKGRVDCPPVKLSGQSYSYKMYDLMECQECKHIALAIHDMVHPGPMIGDAYETKTHYYPPIPARTIPSWTKSLKGQLRKILLETYKAIDYELYSMASTGTRTIIDQLTIDKVGDVGSFNQKLNLLEKGAVIDNEEKELLRVIIDAGSASAHRAFAPSGQTMNSMMDVLESILEKIYIAPTKKVILRRKAEAIRKRTPKRKKL
jgi:hypothetical protein